MKAADVRHEVKPLKQQIPRLLDAVLNSYSALKHVPSESKLTYVLFKPDASGEYLVPVCSHNGVAPNFFKAKQYEPLKDLLFRLPTKNCSAAVAAFDRRQIVIVEHKGLVVTVDDDAQFTTKHDVQFKELANAESPFAVRSMIAIPLVDPVYDLRLVLCLSADRESVFLAEHAWKACEARKHLEARISLLNSYSKLLESLK
jgi:hypothetical protein